MSENDLFGAADAPESMTRPLAVRMRPRTLDEVIGQTQVLGQGSPLRRLANPASKGSLTAPSSVILRPSYPCVFRGTTKTGRVENQVLS